MFGLQSRHSGGRLQVARGSMFGVGSDCSNQFHPCDVSCCGNQQKIMKTLETHRMLGAFTAILIGGSMLGAGNSTAQTAEASAGEVLTRGPVHEAFAATVSYDPEPGIIVNVQPPSAIEEIPPDQRLEGENVTWIPGYWAWDEDRDDFLWVSGIWRNLPPGRQWVPGYWAQADGRHQWTSGYWEDAEVAEVSYLPKPPRSLERGPNIDAPSRDVSWLPGSWVWQDERYAWRSGYWAPVRENWIWVPSHHRWTRRGYVYVDGYWDYGVARRGVLFAPVHFDRNVYSRPDFRYTPTTVINISVFVNHLFVRPRYGHYYFGDYYAPSYRDNGYYASYHYNNTRSGFDPIYSHYRWENRNDDDWDRQRREYFEYRRDNEDARPPRTWAALSSIPEAERRAENFAVAQPLDRLVGSEDRGRQRFQAVDKQDRERFVSQREEIGKFTRERKQLETSEAKVATDESPAPAARVKVNRSPVVAKQSDRAGSGDAPPERLAPRASERQATQKGTDRKKDEQAEPPKLPEGQPKVEPGRERDRTERRSESESATKMKPEPKREVTPEPARKTEAERGRRDDSSPTREPKSKSAPREGEPGPDRKAEPSTPKTAEPTAPKNEQRRPEPERRERTEKKQEPQVQQQPSRRVEPTPVEREQAQRPQQPSRKVEPAPAERQQTQRSQQPSRRVEPAPVEREQAQRPQQPPRKVEPAPTVERRQAERPRPESQQAKPERAAPKQPEGERAPRPEASKEKEEERGKKDKDAE